MDIDRDRDRDRDAEMEEIVGPARSNYNLPQLRAAILEALAAEKVRGQIGMIDMSNYGVRWNDSTAMWEPEKRVGFNNESTCTVCALGALLLNLQPEPATVIYSDGYWNRRTYVEQVLTDRLGLTEADIASFNFGVRGLTESTALYDADNKLNEELVALGNEALAFAIAEYGATHVSYMGEDDVDSDDTNEDW